MWKEKKKSLTSLDTIFILTIIICIVVSFEKISFIEMNESQILYLFSMEAQVVAALFALTLTGYIFYSHFIKNKVNEDNELLGIIEVHKIRSDKRLKYIAGVSIACIILCIMNIVLLNSLYNLIYLQSLLLNLGNVFTIFSIISIIFFSINILNPKIQKISAEELSQKESLKYQEVDKPPNEKENRLNEFLHYYNLLSKCIENFSKEIQNKHGYYVNREGIIESLKILIDYNVIDNSYKDRVYQLIVYKNLLMHSKNELVDYEEYVKLRKLYHNILIKTKTYREEYLNGKKKW